VVTSFLVPVRFEYVVDELERIIATASLHLRLVRSLKSGMLAACV
jgi:hypothetical protein